MDQRLETFLTVCATMNYRKAAEQLHLTQPAVTKQIQALEALYGVRLFTYDSRKLRKTPQGETLEIYAISQRYQDEELRRALKRQEKTSLRIGATKSINWKNIYVEGVHINTPIINLVKSTLASGYDTAYSVSQQTGIPEEAAQYIMDMSEEGLKAIMEATAATD